MCVILKKSRKWISQFGILFLASTRSCALFQWNWKYLSGSFLRLSDRLLIGPWHSFSLYDLESSLVFFDIYRNHVKENFYRHWANILCNLVKNSYGVVRFWFLPSLYHIPHLAFPLLPDSPLCTTKSNNSIQEIKARTILDNPYIKSLYATALISLHKFSSTLW